MYYIIVIYLTTKWIMLPIMLIWGRNYVIMTG